MKITKSSAPKELLNDINYHQPSMPWVVLLLSLIIMLTASLGVPSEEVLQDTFKSSIVSIGTLIALIVFLLKIRHKNSILRWHVALVFPLLLMFYSLASMFWSHTYLASVEAIRWLIFSLLVWVGMNTLTRELFPRLILGIHIGVTVASFWTALQFWFDFNYFPQGAIPASTFVNRNFFAEFSVCALPFSIYLIANQKPRKWFIILPTSIGFNISVLLMTGTRSALIGLIFTIAICSFLLRRYQKQLAFGQWKFGMGMLVLAATILIALGLSTIPTNNQKLIAEFGGGSALDHAFHRTISLAKSSEYTEGSFSIRSAMWRATGKMIEANPITGVGAGAWEVYAPLYQTAGTHIETDFYAHNEFLQLIAEYGIIGWIFLLGISIYLLKTAQSTWMSKCTDAPIRAFALCSIFILFFVSSVGFPWRLATTGALFALSLALLFSSDVEYSENRGIKLHGIWKITAGYISMLTLLSVFTLAIALILCERAFTCEINLVRAAKIALTITKSGQPNAPQWNEAKKELLKLLANGIAINPHYRKLAPIAADEMASWGDWKNAIWIWEKTSISRPYVVAFVTNIARGYLENGEVSKAQKYLDRAKQLQPTANAVRSLEAMIFMQNENFLDAKPIIQELISTGYTDYDTIYAAYWIGTRTKDWALAVRALDIRINKWPSEAYDGWLKLGDIYRTTELIDIQKAIECYKKALETAPAPIKDIVWNKIPAEYKTNLQ